jgi:hypothetical protein
MLGLAALFDKRDGEVGSAAHAAFVAAISDPFYDTVPARAVVSRTGFPFFVPGPRSAESGPPP